RFAKQGLHSQRPLQPWPLLDQPLEVPQLMGQTQLQLLGRRFQLRTETITDPARGPLLAHDLGNDPGSPTGTNQVVDPPHTPKHPLPPGTTGDADTGLVTADDCTLSDPCPKCCRHWLRGLACPVQDSVHAPFADLYAKQLTTELRHSLIAQMLLVLEIHHRRLQARPKTACGFQPLRQHPARDLLTVRTDYLMLARLDHDGHDGRQPGELVPDYRPGRHTMQVRLTVLTALHAKLKNPIRLVHPWARLARMPKGRPQLLP